MPVVIAAGATIADFAFTALPGIGNHVTTNNASASAFRVRDASGIAGATTRLYNLRLLSRG